MKITAIPLEAGDEAIIRKITPLPAQVVPPRKFVNRTRKMLLEVMETDSRTKKVTTQAA